MKLPGPIEIKVALWPLSPYNCKIILCKNLTNLILSFEALLNTNKYRFIKILFRTLFKLFYPLSTSTRGKYDLVLSSALTGHILSPHQNKVLLNLFLSTVSRSMAITTEEPIPHNITAKKVRNSSGFFLSFLQMWAKGPID